MSEQTECDYCGGSLEPDERDSGTCDGCWYGMRLEPEAWEARLAAIGRKPIYCGGCVPFATQHGMVGIACRSPYAPPLKVVDGGDGGDR